MSREFRPGVVIMAKVKIAGRGVDRSGFVIDIIPCFAEIHFTMVPSFTEAEGDPPGTVGSPSTLLSRIGIQSLYNSIGCLDGNLSREMPIAKTKSIIKGTVNLFCLPNGIEPADPK